MNRKRVLAVLALSAGIASAFSAPLDLIGDSKFIPSGAAGVTPTSDPYNRQTLGILPVGANFKQIAAQSGTSAVIFAREALTGWWKSTNYGLTWQREPQIPLGRLCPDPANVARLFIVDDTSRIVSRSIDSGRTWNIVINTSAQGDATIKNTSADLQFADPGVVYFRKSALPNPGIYVSTNAGANWILRHDPESLDFSPPMTVGRNLSKGRRLYTARFQTIRWSDDDAQTWHSTFASLPQLDPVFFPGFIVSQFLGRGFGASPTVPRRLYANVELNYEYIERFGVSFIIPYDRVMQSNDGGLTWSTLPGYRPEQEDSIPAPNGSQGAHFFQVVSQTLSSQVRDAIYIGHDRLVQIVPSQNKVNFLDTENFTDTPALAITPRQVTTLALNPLNASSFFTSTPAGVFRGTWNPAGTSLNWNAYASRLPLHPVRSLTDARLAMSNLIGGHHVSQGSNGVWQRLPMQFSEDMKVIRHPASPHILFACENIQVNKSSNGGQTWTPVPPPPSGAGPYFFTSLQFAKNNPDRLYGIAYLNTFPPNAYLLEYRISTNTWTPIAAPMDGSYFRALIASPGLSGRFYAAFQNVQGQTEITHKRDDDDDLHRSIPPMPRVDALMADPANPRRLFLIGGTQQMWADFTDPYNPAYTPVLAPSPSGVVDLFPLGPSPSAPWALLTRDGTGHTTIHLSQNTGLSWTDISTPSALPPGFAVDLRWDDALAQLLIARRDTGIWSLNVARPAAALLPGTIAPTALKALSGSPADAAARDGRLVTYTPLNTSLTSFALDNVVTSPTAAPAHVRLRLRLQLEYPSMTAAVSLYNFQKSKYDLFTTTPGSPIGTDLTISPPNPAPYINPSTRQLRARLTITPTGASPAWQAPLDQFAWEITP